MSRQPPSKEEAQEIVDLERSIVDSLKGSQNELEKLARIRAGSSLALGSDSPKNLVSRALSVIEADLRAWEDRLRRM